ncbi:MAG: DEAD/DEAH box helicase, partial [Treponema porcinum]
MKELENNSMDDEIVSIESQTEEKTEAAAEDAEISFEDLGLDEQTLAAIEKKGFKVPSPIQALAIPRLLSGESNMIARARTGTGKTAAFGLPIIQKLRNENGTVKALILEPTRELAMQTCTEMQSFTEGKSPRTCVLYGGASYSTQIKDLRRGTEIVVGTPGRIQDHLERGTLDISKIDYFILDEGDEMLDMGFVDDIEHIFEQANPDARILLFSATMPEEILKIAQKFMGDYEIVEEEGVIDEPLLIDQKFWILRESEKPDALVRLIDISDDFYGVVFTQTKSDADYVSRILDEKGYEAAALHGDIAQSQREKILARFRSRKTKILVATDVAARGIDISGLTHVVNYSLPFDGATYVHRIGRTGRAGSAGVAVTFVCPKETRKLGYLQKAVRKASKGEMKEEPIPTIDEVLKKKSTRIFSELKEKLGLNEQPVPSDSTKETDAEQETQDGQTVSEPAEQQELPAEQKTSAAETENGSEEKSVNDEENSKQPSKSNLIKVSSNFEKMAEDLCRGNDSQDVLAAVLSVIYSSKLDKSRYGKIQGHASSSDQTRLYIQLGRKD